MAYLLEEEIDDRLSMRPDLLVGLLVLIAAALLLPIWLVRYPPLLDYPNHLARTYVLANLNNPEFHLSRWYRAEWGPYPYLAMDVILIALQKFMTAEIAGKVFLSLCALLAPASVWWFVRNANPRNQGLAFFGLLLGHGPFFLQGFVNFQLGLALCFFTLGSWLAYLRRPSSHRWLIVFVLAAATYFAHLVAFALAGFVVFVYTLASGSFRRLPHAIAPFIPGVVLYFVGAIGYGGELDFRSWDEKLFSGLSALSHAYSPSLERLTVAAIVLCIALVVIRNPDFELRRPWAVVWVALFVLYCALPNEVGEAWEIDTRVIPVLFVVLLALATVGRRAVILAMIALGLFAARTADVAYNFVDKQTSLNEMAGAVASIAPGSRLLPLVNEDDTEDPFERLYVHFWAYAVIERHAFAPYLFDLKGQMALRTTANVYIPPRPLKDVSWSAVRRDYDYVLLYNFPLWAGELETIGDMVYTSKSYVVYRIHPPPSPAADSR